MLSGNDSGIPLMNEGEDVKEEMYAPYNYTTPDTTRAQQIALSSFAEDSCEAFRRSKVESVVSRSWDIAGRVGRPFGMDNADVFLAGTEFFCRGYLSQVKRSVY